MAVEKKFLHKLINEQIVKDYLGKELSGAGVSTITIQKTPLATRVAIRVRRPSVVIGKRGSNVKAVSEELTRRFGIENPQLDVIEVEKPELDAKLVAQRISRQIEIEGNVKQTMRFNMNDVMNAGALGCELRVAGKVVGKGGKSKSIRMRKGYLKKSGDVMKLVDKAYATAYLKAGAIGILVKIVPPGTIFPDAAKIDEEQLDAILAIADQEAGLLPPAETVEAPEKPGEAAKESEEAGRKLEQKIEKAKAEAAAKLRNPVARRKTPAVKPEVLIEGKPPEKKEEEPAAKGG
ncbi:MAG: 30S ribosomal protein S3 [Candidatus Micrarchaeota archaeon]